VQALGGLAVDVDHTIGVVGDDSVDAPLDETADVFRVVDRPGDDGDALAPELGNGFPAQAVVSRGDDRCRTVVELALELAVAYQIGPWYLRRQLAHRGQSAGVEGLDDRAIFQPVLLHGIDDETRQLLDRQIGAASLQLDLDAEPHRVVGALGQGQHFLEPGDARPRDSLLFRKLRVGSRSAIDPRQIGVVELIEGGRGQLAAVVTAAQLPVQLGVMMHDDDVVASDLDVQLQRRHAELESLLERRQRVLRAQAPAAPMALDVQRLCGFVPGMDSDHREEQQGRDDQPGIGGRQHAGHGNRIDDARLGDFAPPLADSRPPSSRYRGAPARRS
jgi:hypothetical protein